MSYQMHYSFALPLNDARSTQGASSLAHTPAELSMSYQMHYSFAFPLNDAKYPGRF